MKNPESHDPRKTRKPASQCLLGPSFFSPNKNRPRKLDSMKNENTPSMASVCPITPPDRKSRNPGSQCLLGPSFFSPNKNRPRKLDSMKNENTPSMASVCPITPPADFEKRAQLVPNWNSIGMPVTTPMAKLMAKIRAQNRAARL